MSQDPVGIKEWLDFVKNPKLNDIHTRNQKDLSLPSRLVAKVFLFRCVYRGPAYAYANDPDFMHVSTSERYWQKVIDRFFDKYRGLNRKHIEFIQQATTTGKITSPTGRVYEFERNARGKWNESDITNWPNQGLGADVMAVARILFANRFRRSCFDGSLYGNLVSTVHDSIVTDVPDEYVEPTARLMHETFRDLPQNISKMYGIDWNLPMLCETQAGPNFKDTVEIKVRLMNC